MKHSIFEWRKVVTAKEMARVEKLAIAQGDATSAAYMQKAGEGIADHIEKFCHDQGIHKTLTVIAGKGNNAGDGYTVAHLLKEKGFEVLVYQLYPLEESSLLCREHANRFLQMNGHIVLVAKPNQLKNPREGLVLDAILGTGFSGSIEGVLAEVIHEVNNWHLPVISIDIASGISGDDGTFGKQAIFATHTVALGAYKLGHFIDSGYLHAGDLHIVSFGMSEKFIEQLEPSAYLISRHLLKEEWPKRKKTDHKYLVGQVLAFAGSHGMGGAALLATTSALRAGAGIVKLFHPKGIEGDLIQAPYELIKGDWEQRDLIIEELKRTKSVIIGPGMGKAKEGRNFLEFLMPLIDIPAVIDADALSFFPTLPKSKGPVILTPHVGEFLKLIQTKKESLLVEGQKYADEHHVTLVLKGAPTYIFHPKQKPLIAPYGTPGMATAGSGDVLTGIIGAILARGIEPRKAAAMGVLLHQLAGEVAAHYLSEDFMCASDIIASFPEVLSTIAQRA